MILVPNLNLKIKFYQSIIVAPLNYENIQVKKINIAQRGNYDSIFFLGENMSMFNSYRFGTNFCIQDFQFTALNDIVTPIPKFPTRYITRKDKTIIFMHELNQNIFYEIREKFFKLKNQIE